MDQRPFFVYGGSIVPLSKYDRFYGGKSGSAAKAKSAMAKEYGEEKGEKVFYALKNKRKSMGKSSPKRGR